MRIPARAVLTFVAGVLTASCVSSDSSTGVGDSAYPAHVVFQPSVVPTAADASALPINRIRAVTSLWPSNVVLADTTIVVDPGAAEWDLTLGVSLRESPVLAQVFLYLINQADSARIQYSGKTDTLRLTRNGVADPGDVPLVRGPLSNLYVTGVTITGPGAVVERRTLALTADVESSSTSTQPPVVFWTSLDTSVVTIAGSSAFGVRTGSAQVVATAGILSDTATVTVTIAPVGSVQVAPTTANIVIGTTVSLAATVRADDGVVLTDRPVRWASSDPSIAVVDSLTGVVTGLELGTATVSATSEGVTGTATVTVVPVPVASVLVSPDSVDVAVGATFAFEAQTFDGGGNELVGRSVTWTSGNPSVATVDASTGLVRGVAAGVTTVTATSEGVSDQAIVVVPSPAGGSGGVNTWLGGPGNWSDVSKWSLGRAPIPADTVELTQGVDYSVQMDVDATVALLTIGGTTDVISLVVGDRTLTITDTRAEPATLEMLPLSNLTIGNGRVVTLSLNNNGSIYINGAASIETTILINSNSVNVATGVLFLDGPSGVDFRHIGSLTVGDGAAFVLAPGASNRFSYLDGTIDGTGGLILEAQSALEFYADLTLDGPYLVLEGASTVAVAASRLSIGPASFLSLISTDSTQTETNTVVVSQGSVFANGPRSYANDSLYIGVDASLVVGSGTEVTRFGTVDVVNAGSIIISASAADAHFGPGAATGRRILNQTGSVMYTVGPGTAYLEGELVNEGDLIVNGPTELSRRNAFGTDVAASHVNSGTITASGGDLTVVLGGTSPTFTNSGEILIITPATITVNNLSDGSVVNEATGTITGDGTFEFLGSPGGGNFGSISPGYTYGALTWLGAIPMGSTSVLDIELLGADPTLNDRLDVSGEVLVDGTLSVNTLFGYAPSPGDRFPIMTFGQRTPGSTFAAVGFPSTPGVTYDTVWAEAGSVDTLYVVASAGSPTVLNRWVNPAGGNWSVGANWSSGVAPAAGDSAVIDEAGTYNVTVDANGVADHLSVGGPSATVTLVHDANTLSVSQSLTVAAGSSYALGGTAVLTGAHVGSFDGDMLWSGGTWGGTGTTTLRSSGNDFSGGSKTLNARSLVNEGTLAWTSGLISPSNSSTFLNASGATWFIQGDNATYSSGGGVSIINEGSIVRDTGTGIATIGPEVASSGPLDVQTGTLRFAGPLSNSGTVTILLGATLDLDGTSIQFDGTLLQGDGTIDVTGMIGGDLSGDIAPGGVGAVGTFTWISDYDPSTAHSLLIDLGGVGIGESDLFLVQGGLAGFAGTLEVNLVAYDPALGDTIPIVVFEDEGGKFNDIVLPSVAGVTLDTLWTNNGPNPDTLYIVAESTPSPMLLTSFESGHNEVWSVSPDGQTFTQLTGLGGDSISWDPEWSPDGTQIVFSTARDGLNDHVWIMEDDGSLQTEVTNDATQNVYPSWSPDGAQIVFAKGPQGAGRDIWTMNKDGTGQTQRTNSGFEDSQPDWSPDGASIVFFSARNGNWQIYTMDANGSNQVRRTSNSANDFMPQYSPDGTRIAFVSDRNGNFEIYVMNADGTGQTRLTSDAGSDLQPSWSSDGRFIVFSSDRSGDQEIYIMDADGSNPRLLTTNSGPDQFPSLRGN